MPPPQTFALSMTTRTAIAKHSDVLLNFQEDEDWGDEDDGEWDGAEGDEWDGDGGLVLWTAEGGDATEARALATYGWPPL